MIVRILLVLLILFASAADAANHYIRAGAAGSGSGDDWTNAYTTWPGSFTRGDTYYIASGSYTGKVFTTAHSGTTRITIKKATTGDHGTETGWSASYATGQVAFTSGLEFRTGYWTVDGVTGGGYGSWDSGFGMKITETRDAEALIKLGNPTLAGSTGHNTAPSVYVYHVDMQGKGSVSVNGGSYSNDGVANYANDDFLLSYYWMHGIGRCPVYSSGRNMVIENGWVQSFYGSASVHSEIASVWGFSPAGVTPIGTHTFRYNLFTHIWSTGGLMWDGADNAAAYFNVYGNVFYKPAGATWEVANGLIGGWSARNFRNARVYNNTFINVDQESLSTLPGTYSNNEAYNNLWYNSTSPNFSRFATHDYNHFINSGGTHSEANGTSAASGDPFTNYTGYYFTLTGATTAGNSLASPFNLDGLGITRGADGTWDRGAYEYSSGGADTTPPTRSAGSPSGTLAAGTTSTTLSLTTNEAATCKYGTSAATAYASIANTFSTTGSTSHSQTISGLSNGSSYTYYVRCQDGAGNPNTDDYSITFSVASGGGGGGGGTPTYIQGKAYRNSATATTATATFDTNVTAGSAIVVLYGYAGAAASATCSDSLGNTYVTAVDQRDSTNDQNAGACYALNSSAGANTVTVTFSTSRQWRYALASEYSNVATASALDTSAWAMATSTTPSSGAATTASNGDLIWGGVLATSGTSTITAGTGFTRRLLGATEPTDAATEDKIQSSAGSVAADWTFGTSRKHIAIMLALKASGPAISPPVISGTLSKTCFVRLACSYQISASNTPTSYGATGLPTGLSLNSSTGLITGSVTTQQNATVALSATNSGGTGNANLSMTIASVSDPVKRIKPDRGGIRRGDRIGR